MDHVLADLEREVAADRAGGRPRAGSWRRSPGGRRFTASWPSSTIATSGPPVMNSTSSPKKGLLLVLGVVLLGQLASTVMCLRATILQALALEAGDDLAGQAAGEGVGLHQDQSPVHVGLLSEGSVSGRGAADWAGSLRLARAGGSLPVLGAGGCGRAGAAPPARPRARSTGRSSSAGRAACRRCVHGSFSWRRQLGQRRKALLDRRSRSTGTPGGPCRPAGPRPRRSRARARAVLEELRRAHDHVDDRAR